jgi:hypothetical protein
MIGSKHDWANLNTLRSYPLEYSRNPVADTGLVFDDYILSDLLIVAQANEYEPRLSSIHFSSQIISLCFYDTIKAEDSFIVQAPLSSSYAFGNIINVGSTLVSGSCIFGVFNEILKYTSTGIHKFSKNDSTVNTHCIFLAGDPPILSMSGGGSALMGDVALFAGGKLNANSSVIDDGHGNKTTNVIFSLDDPDEFVEKCAVPQNICECVFPPIEKINTVYPDANGNIDIVTELLDTNNIQIETSQNNVILSVVGNNEEVCDRGLPSEEGILPTEIE